MNMKLRKRKISSRQGATAVEFALVAPILFLVLFAGIEFARMMMTVSMIEQSAFQAARHVAVLGSTTAEGEAIVREELGFFGIDDADVTIVGLTTGGSEQSQIDDSTQRISVNVVVTFDDFLLFTPSNSNIERTAIVRAERF